MNEPMDLEEKSKRIKELRTEINRLNEIIASVHDQKIFGAEDKQTIDNTQMRLEFRTKNLLLDAEIQGAELKLEAFQIIADIVNKVNLKG